MMSEHEEQKAVIQWCEMQKNIYPHVDRIFAIPNGGHRHKAVAGKMKAEGVKAGVPDLMLPVARGGYHGLFIEMKFGRNKPTESQRDWLDFLATQGYCIATCWDRDDAIETLIDYYEMDDGVYYGKNME